MKGSGKHLRQDTRATWAKGYQISSQVISIAFELVLPGLVGFFADRRLHIFPILTVLGLVFGFTSGTIHFIHFAKTLNGGAKQCSDADQRPREDAD
ncbi:MAG: AtpZ/AtpI family protein [Thermogutta sp.]